MVGTLGLQSQETDDLIKMVGGRLISMVDGV